MLPYVWVLRRIRTPSSMGLVQQLLPHFLIHESCAASLNTLPYLWVLCSIPYPTPLSKDLTQRPLPHSLIYGSCAAVSGLLEIAGSLQLDGPCK